MNEQEAAALLIENGGMRIKSIPLQKWFEAVRLAVTALHEKAEHENPKPLTEEEIRARAGQVIAVVRTTAMDEIKTSKVIVDIFKYRDDHCLILWKYGIRAYAGNKLSQFERNCLLLPFGELNYSWIAYDNFPERYIKKEDRPRLKRMDTYGNQ